MITRSESTNEVGPGEVSRREVPTAHESLAGPHVSPARLAGYWGVSPRTVYRDIRKGALRAFRLPGGQIRIRTADARRYGRPIE